MTSKATFPEQWCLRTRIGDYAVWADSQGLYVQKDFANQIFICWKDLGALQAAAYEEHLGENGELRSVMRAAGLLARKAG